jgi:IclR family pca regulon transcriptional regulator
MAGNQGGEAVAPDALPSANPKNLVHSAAKVFAVLRAFGPDLPELTVSEVAARAELDRGTAFRLIHTLIALGYLRAVPGTRRFRLTLRCLELGFAALSANDLPGHAEPLLRELVPGVADAGSLGVIEGGEVVYLQRVQHGLDRSGVVRRPGTRVGAYATALGHAILAYLPRHRQIEHLEGVERVMLSERTVTDLDALLARLEAVRGQGYAVSDGENAYGLRTVAAPVLGTDGLPLAGVSLTIGAGRQPIDAFVETALPHLRRLTEELTEGVRLSLGAIGVRRAG